MWWQNVEIVRRIYTGLNRTGSFDLELIDPSVELRESDEPGARAYRGHQGVQEFLGQIQQEFEDVRWHPRQMRAQEDHVVVVAELSGRALGSGAKVESDETHVWTLREGKAVRIQGYRSASEAFAAVGLLE
jgi:ketosteroid isomerase-like protein